MGNPCVAPLDDTPSQPVVENPLAQLEALYSGLLQQYEDLNANTEPALVESDDALLISEEPNGSATSEEPGATM